MFESSITRSEPLQSDGSRAAEKLLSEVYSKAAAFVSNHPVETTAVAVGTTLALCIKPAKLLASGLSTRFGAAAESALVNAESIAVRELSAVPKQPMVAGLAARRETVYLTSGHIPLSPTEAMTSEFVDGTLAKALSPAKVEGLRKNAESGVALLFHDIFGRFGMKNAEKEATLMGSAWYVGNGKFVTNAHCVGDIRQLNLWTRTGRIVPVWREELIRDADLAILRLEKMADARSFTALELGSSKGLLEKKVHADLVHVGFPDRAQISGSARPILRAEAGTLTGTANIPKRGNADRDGVISFRSLFEDEPVLVDGVTTARLTSGFSGGPVLGRDGKVLGITWGSNQPAQIPSFNEAWELAMQGRVWTPPLLLPANRERSFFVPVEYLKNALDKRQSAKVKAYFKIG